MDILKHFFGLQYILMIVFIMMIAGLAKEYNLFSPLFNYIKNTFKSNKFVIVILSAIGGILPIEGRVTVSAGILDTIAPKNPESRKKYGIIDYLSTHHYYMWSPLEKTVILPIAAFGLTYISWLGIVWPLIVISLLFIFWYIHTQMKDVDIQIENTEFKMSAVIRNIFPLILTVALYIKTNNYIMCFGLLALYYMILTQTFNISKLLSYINWEVIFTVAIVIVLGSIIKTYDKQLQSYIMNLGIEPTGFVSIAIFSFLGFVISFLLGSSSKFVALAILITSLFGMQYFLWFFVIDYIGYLLSPTHKCFVIGNRYFNTPIIEYTRVVSAWCLCLLIVAGVITFIL